MDEEIEASAARNIFNQPVAPCATPSSVTAQGKGNGESNLDLGEEPEILEDVCRPRSLIHSSHLENTQVNLYGVYGMFSQGNIFLSRELYLVFATDLSGWRIRWLWDSAGSGVQQQRFDRHGSSHQCATEGNIPGRFLHVSHI